MATIYQLTVGDEPIGDFYYFECDAVDKAMQVAKDTKEIVTIWEAEEIDEWGYPLDALDWSINRVVWV